MRDFTYDCGAMPISEPAFSPIDPPCDLARDLSPYAGRWIALVRGRIAGVGVLPHEARLLAKAARPKEEPTVVFVPRKLTR